MALFPSLRQERLASFCGWLTGDFLSFVNGSQGTADAAKGYALAPD